jgi:cytidine deaminase
MRRPIEKTGRKQLAYSDYFYQKKFNDNMRSVELTCHFKECDVAELSETERDLLEKARQSMQRAYAPYSNFHVGVAVLLENGAVVLGNNQENASYPLGLCAERVAVFAASANYPGIKIKTIALTASSKQMQINKPVTPCGACRQVIAEYEFRDKQPIRMIMAGEKGRVLIVESVKELLPYQFTADDLKSK